MSYLIYVSFTRLGIQYTNIWMCKILINSV